MVHLMILMHLTGLNLNLSYRFQMLDKVRFLEQVL
jgi:hypothetical protein